ncbi:MAG: hypothetical protein ABDH23_03255 [Endomicrobiia bacterium]
MDEKLLFVYSKEKRIYLPEVLFKEYQIRAIPSNLKISREILEYKPQIILLDEFVQFGLAKKICNRFKFIPIGIVGYFEKPKKIENFLELGVNIINLNQPQEEINSTIKNLLWFSLSKQEIWDEEYKISKSENIKEKIWNISKIFIEIFVILLLVVGVPKLYNFIISHKKLFYELDVGYITACDVCIVGDRYILNDWTLRNLFEYGQTNDKLLKMYVPQEQINSLSVNHSYAVAFSMFTEKIYLYKYPEFSLITSTELLKNTTVLSIYIDENNHLYLLDNKSAFYEFVIKDNRFVFISSFVIKEIFPLDVVVKNEDIYILDNANNIHRLKKNSYKKEKTIVFSQFFDIKQYKFSSFAFSERWLYLVSEKDKKVFKLPTNILKI